MGGAVGEEDQGGGLMKVGEKGRAMHWALVTGSSLALVVGQSAATLLSRYYFDNGGGSRWLSTLLQVVGWPILFIPLLFIHYTTTDQSSRMTPFTLKLALIYLGLGVLLTGDDLLYSWGVSYMPASTYSIVCASQLAFNALFSLVLNHQKFTFNILNSLVILTFGSVLLGIDSDGDRPAGVSRRQYIIGFICTLAASALYGLLLSLMQLVFRKVLKKGNLTVILEMQMYMSVVSTVICIVGLLVGGELKDVQKEAGKFTTGSLAYWMTVIWSAIAWQVCSVGVVGLIPLVSSLFSNVISTLSLPVVPILSFGFFHDKVTALKIISMLLSIWGFVSYIYDEYVASSTKSENQETSASPRENQEYTSLNICYRTHDMEYAMETHDMQPCEQKTRHTIHMKRTCATRIRDTKQSRPSGISSRAQKNIILRKSERNKVDNETTYKDKPSRGMFVMYLVIIIMVTQET